MERETWFSGKTSAVFHLIHTVVISGRPQAGLSSYLIEKNSELLVSSSSDDKVEISKIFPHLNYVLESSKFIL